jgi:hypothetical protein
MAASGGAKGCRDLVADTATKTAAGQDHRFCSPVIVSAERYTPRGPALRFSETPATDCV